MKSIRIDILESSVEKVLEDLQSKNLIKIKYIYDNDLWDVVHQIRKEASEENITLEEITKEVEEVRQQRYEAKNNH